MDGLISGEWTYGWMIDIVLLTVGSLKGCY